MSHRTGLFLSLLLTSCVSADIDRGPRSPANPRAPAAHAADVSRALTEDPAPVPSGAAPMHHHRSSGDAVE